MENNIYEAPQSELSGAETLDNNEFYVVSTRKFTILLMLTFGLYTVFWFYKNWKLYKSKNEEDIWPIARGIFSIFFAHSLFENVNVALENRSLIYKWSPSIYASLYVVFAIVGRILDKLSSKGIGSPYSDLTSILLIPAICFVLLKAQGAINLSQDDVSGVSNSKFTLSNYLWCFAGGILWLFVVLGLLDMFGVVNLEA